MIRLLLGLVVAALAACEPCSGTPSCTGVPEVSYGGQFIEHTTGRSIAGVQVTFERDSGPFLTAPVIAATSDGDGFFQLRALAWAPGTVFGRLTVTPPPPHQPYVVRDFRMRTAQGRADGVYLGRLVVDPYMFIVGEVRDRLSGQIVVGANVTLYRLSGTPLQPDTIETETDGYGRFFLQPGVAGAGPVRLQALISAPGYPRAYRINFEVPARFIDRPAYDVSLLRLRPAFQYVGEVTRRGSREVLPGVRVEFRRTGGIPVSPEIVVPEITGAGLFAITPEPLVDVENGELVGDLTIIPPAPFPTEMIKGLRLIATDGDSARLLGHFGYGAQLYVRAPLVHRADGSALRKGIQTRVWQRGGVPITLVPADSGIRDTDSTGSVPFIAPTPDSGVILLGAEVRIPGFAPETITVTTRAQYDSAPHIPPPTKVGPWYPWYGVLLDADTDMPIAGARITFQPIGGTGPARPILAARSGADGTFRFTQVPRVPGALRGTLRFAFDSLHAPLSASNVLLAPTQDDTLRPLGVFRAVRARP